MSGTASAADLNTLLRWATENTPAPTTGASPSGSTAVAPRPSANDAGAAGPPASADDQPLGLTFRPGPGVDLSVVPSHDAEAHRQQAALGALHRTEDKPQQRAKLDTAVLDAIMGKTDALRIREAMTVFEDEGRLPEEREAAGDELEELIEDLDNANGKLLLNPFEPRISTLTLRTADLEPLGMWPRLLPLLSSREARVRFFTAWIVGTAAQNNPKAQAACLKRDPLPAVLGLLSSAQPEDVQSKAMYCLGSLLRHAPPEALRTFYDAGGWGILEASLRGTFTASARKAPGELMIRSTGPSLNLRRKTAFLLNTLALDEAPEASTSTAEPSTAPLPLIEPLESSGIYKTLVESLSPSRGVPTGPDGDLAAQDEDYIEKGLRALVTIIATILTTISHSSPKADLDAGLKKLTAEVVQELKGLGGWQERLESAGVAKDEWQIVERWLQL